MDLNKREAISVVIPTKDRQRDMERSLNALCLEAELIKEIVIIDSSEEKYPIEAVPEILQGKCIIKSAEASVCVQRNNGIAMATAPFIFLCDDDVEITKDYLSSCLDYLEQNEKAQVCSGLFLEQNESSEWMYLYPPKSLRGVWFRLLFKLSNWYDWNQLSGAKFWINGLSPKANINHLTWGGWPNNVSFEKEVCQLSIYSLGASVSRKSWLQSRPFDEVLDSHGIGDNFGVLMQGKDKRAFHLIQSISVRHHKSKSNRLNQGYTYMRRCLALHYFLSTLSRFNFINRLFYVWSILGNGIYFILSGKSVMTKASIKILRYICTGKNPYLIAAKEGNRITKIEF